MALAIRGFHATLTERPKTPANRTKTGGVGSHREQQDDTDVDLLDWYLDTRDGQRYLQDPE